LRKLLAERKIALKLDEQATAWLANTGYDAVYGARPLKRVIQKNLQDPLAQQILAGAIKDGATVAVAVRGGALTLNGERVETAAAAKPNLRLLN
jgi:ATP-dependent Clp protease ATP-binding subunit ClpB